MRATHGLLVTLLAIGSSGALPFGGEARLTEARDAITAIDLPKAKGILSSLDPNEPAVAYELGRLALYQGDCDDAARRFAPPAVQALPDGGIHLNVARDCARAMAATVTVEDPRHGVVVRFQDDADAHLTKFIGETVQKQRAVLAKDLGVELLLPIRVDVVRDQHSLSALTGLPKEAARKTGTVAIAKFGRVIMLSPRAPSLGYAWRDTLAHELTHLALSRGTLDRAPLWLQEGVAKREETRWRAPMPSDDALPPDAIAAVGWERGLALPLDGLGPSIALLPSAQQAMVAYAEVASFVRFLAGDRAGEKGAPADTGVLPKLVAAYARGLDTDQALVDVTGKDLKGWDAIWRPWVAGKKTKLPKALGLDPPSGTPADRKAFAVKERDERRGFRLGQLLVARGHGGAARTRLDPQAAAHPGDPLIGTWAARARLLSGDLDGARAMLDPGRLVGDLGGWWAVRGEALQRAGAAAAEIGEAWQNAIAHEPLAPEASCGWAEDAGATFTEDWIEAAVRGLCTAARARNLPKLGQD